jgi:hypothetical protein
MYACNPCMDNLEFIVFQFFIDEGNADMNEYSKVKRNVKFKPRIQNVLYLPSFTPSEWWRGALK